MATGEKRTNFYSRRNLSLSMLSTYMYNNLRQQVLDLTRALYNSRGVFSGGLFTFASNDAVSISATEALDNQGHLIILEAHSNISFANVSGTTYYVGYKYVEVEVPETPTNAVEISPFSGIFNYRFYEENVGEIGNPDQVIDNDNGTITLVVDGVVGALEAVASNNAGRSIKVWLTNPISGNAGWYEDQVIKYGTNPNWAGNKNYITTQGDFHQQALIDAISTDTTAYRIWMHGATITTTDISSDTNYIFLGTITGNGPHVVPVIHDQSGIISLPTSVDSYKIYIDQLAKDYYGDAYNFTELSTRSTRSTGLFTDGDTTPDISDYRTWNTKNTGLTTISTLDGGLRGDIRKIVAKDNKTTLQYNANLLLKDGIDWSMVYGDSITLLCLNAGSWAELGRTEYITGTFTSTSSSTSTTSSSSTCSTSSSSSSTSTTSSSSSSTCSTTSSLTSTSSTTPL